MIVSFWGVRGSIAVSSPRSVRTGGNTSCVELTCDGERLILDGGTGLRALGEAHGFRPLDATVLFSHVHWDHIQGVPFFVPAYHGGSRLRLCGALRQGRSLRDVLGEQMSPPAFPVGLDALQAQLAFTTLRDGQPFEAGPFRVSPLDVDHPGRTLAFRIEAGGTTVVYATDVELGGKLPPALVDLCAGADLLIHDAQYTADELPRKRGWGHSTWEEAASLARTAEVGQLALFHHDPTRDDDAVAVLEARAQDRFAPTLAAREGVTLALGRASRGKAA